MLYPYQPASIHTHIYTHELLILGNNDTPPFTSYPSVYVYVFTPTMVGNPMLLCFRLSHFAVR